MEPIPQTAQLFEEFGLLYDDDLLGQLQLKADAVQSLVPDLVGVSLATLGDGMAFTLVASNLDVAVLDAIQYVAGGPCIEAPLAERVVVYDSAQPEDEELWQTFARATAARGVATTLTLPILEADAVVGTVNLYAASPRAFVGMHRAIAAVFDAWAPGAITNADLSFQTRKRAEEAPAVLRKAMRVETAVGMLMGALSIDGDNARQVLVEAALRAGVTLEQLAETYLKSQARDEI